MALLVRWRGGLPPVSALVVLLLATSVQAPAPAAPPNPLLLAQAPAPAAPPNPLTLAQLQALAALPEGQQRAPIQQIELMHWFLANCQQYMDLPRASVLGRSPLLTMGPPAWREQGPLLRQLLKPPFGTGPYYVYFRPDIENPGTMPEWWQFPAPPRSLNIQQDSTCWEEMQHALLGQDTGFTGAVDLAFFERYVDYKGKNQTTQQRQEHVLIQAAMNVAEWVGQLAGFEQEIRATQRRLNQYPNLRLTPAAEHYFWWQAADRWDQSLRKHLMSGYLPPRVDYLPPEMRSRYASLTGTRLPTVAEVIGFYAAGGVTDDEDHERNRGRPIPVPAWVMTRPHPLRLVRIVSKPDQPAQQVVPADPARGLPERLQLQMQVQVVDSFHPPGEMALLTCPVYRGKLRVYVRLPRDLEPEVKLEVRVNGKLQPEITDAQGRRAVEVDLSDAYRQSLKLSDLKSATDSLLGLAEPLPLEVTFRRDNPSSFEGQRRYDLVVSYQDEPSPYLGPPVYASCDAPYNIELTGKAQPPPAGVKRQTYSIPMEFHTWVHFILSSCGKGAGNLKDDAFHGAFLSPTEAANVQFVRKIRDRDFAELWEVKFPVTVQIEGDVKIRTSGNFADRDYLVQMILLDTTYPNRIDAVRLLGYPSSLGPAETYYDSNAAAAGSASGGALRTKLTHTKTEVLPTVWSNRTEAVCKLSYVYEGNLYVPRDPGPTYEKIDGAPVVRGLGGGVRIMPDATTQPAAAAPRGVRLVPAALEIHREEPLPIIAAVSGVGPDDNPLKFQWTGVTQSLDSRATLEVANDGTYTVGCTVTNIRGEVIGTDSVEILAELPKQLSLTKLDPPGPTVVAGQPVTFEARLAAQGRPATGNYVFRWEPHPEVVFDPHEGPDNTSRATFLRPGKVRVWAEALRKQGGALVTVARSEQMELEVTKPALALSFTPATPYVGQATRVAVTVTPALAPRDLDFRWDFEGNIQELGESPDSRERTFIPRDEKPVRWTAHARSRPHGDDLGEITGQVAAKPYVLTTHVGKPLGPPPVVYKDGVGFVELENELAVGQIVPVTVALEPLPDKRPVSFRWSANGDTELVDGTEGPLVRARRTRPGQAVLRVVAFDAENTRLGETTAEFAVAVSQETLDDGVRRSPRPERFEVIPCETHRNGEPVRPADTLTGLREVWVVARFVGLPPGATLRSRFERDGFVLLEKKETVKTAAGVFLYQFTGDPEVAPGLYRASFRVGAVPVGEKQFTVASGQTGREVTWVERSWGPATFRLPANWVLDLSAADRVAWCAPTGTPADAAVVLRRAASAAARWEEYRQNGATLERKETANLAGKPATLHSMLYLEGRFRFWMLTLDDPQPDGTHLSVSLAGRVDQWSTWEPILQQIRDSIRIRPVADQ